MRRKAPLGARETARRSTQNNAEWGCGRSECLEVLARCVFRSRALAVLVLYVFELLIAALICSRARRMWRAVCAWVRSEGRELGNSRAESPSTDSPAAFEHFSSAKTIYIAAALARARQTPSKLCSARQTHAPPRRRRRRLLRAADFRSHAIATLLWDHEHHIFCWLQNSRQKEALCERE